MCIPHNFGVEHDFESVFFVVVAIEMEYYQRERT